MKKYNVTNNYKMYMGYDEIYTVNYTVKKWYISNIIEIKN